MARTITQLFSEYYSNYRGDDETPTTTDPEWKTFLRLVNFAINRWENVDGVLWRELWASDDSQTIVSSTYDYNVPSDFKFPGSYVRLIDNTNAGNYVDLPVKDLSDSRALNGSFAYFYGNPRSGYKVGLSPNAIIDRTGWTIEYKYYKTAEYIVDSTEDGTSVLEMPDPYFAVHNALANRFRASRNTVGYQTANRDAETALQGMQHRNDMGSPHNPWNILDSDPVPGWGG